MSNGVSDGSNTKKIRKVAGTILGIIILIIAIRGISNIVKSSINPNNSSETTSIDNRVKKGDKGTVIGLIEGAEEAGDSTVLIQIKGYNFNLHYKAKDMESAKAMVGKKIKVTEMPTDPNEYKILELEILN